MKKLKEILKSFGKVLIAYSGGVDSTFLLKTAIDELGAENVLAVVGISETYPESEKAEAKKICKLLGAQFEFIQTQELRDENFASNPKDRCYFCKKELFTSLIKIAGQKGFNQVIDGSNVDDLSDFRPGAIAKKELGIRSPLQEAGLSKKEIRELSKELNLPTWDKPAYACLASRIPYGTKITKETLKKIDEAEQYLREMGFREVRVRDHGALARIEVGEERLMEIMDEDVREELYSKFKKIGYIYVSVDLKGYRMGSSNEALTAYS